MSTKHTVTVLGHTVTRTSQNRVYSHHVMGVQNVAAKRAECEKGARETFAMNFKYHTTLAAGGLYHFNNGCAPKEITAAEQTRAQAYLAAGVEGYVAERLADFDAVKRAFINDGTEYLTDAGWTSRLDLAQKLAAKTCKWCERAIITESTIIGK